MPKKPIDIARDEIKLLQNELKHLKIEYSHSQLDIQTLLEDLMARKKADEKLLNTYVSKGWFY